MPGNVTNDGAEGVFVMGWPGNVTNGSAEGADVIGWPEFVTNDCREGGGCHGNKGICDIRNGIKF